MAPAKKGREKEGHSAISEVMTREYTSNIHKHIHEVGFKECTPQAVERIQKYALKEMELQMYTLTPSSTKLSGPEE